MVFKRTFKYKRDYIPNKMRNTPIISFKAKLSPACLEHIKKLKKRRQANKFINEAIESYYFQMMDPKSYWKQIIKNNYYFIRILVRKVGRENGKNKMQ